MFYEEREVAILPEKLRTNAKGVHIRPTYGNSGRLKVEIVPTGLEKVIPEEAIRGVVQQFCDSCPLQTDCRPRMVKIESSLSIIYIIARNPDSRKKDYLTKNGECPLKNTVVRLPEFLKVTKSQG